MMNACAEKKDFILVDHGKSSYKIVLSNEASKSEKHAANELQHFIHLATDVKIPIINENDDVAREPQRIFIGTGNLLNRLFSAYEIFKQDEWQELGDEGFVIHTFSNGSDTPDIVIAGGRKRGTMYGVYTFLEHLGFRWYTNRKTWFPEGDILRVPLLAEREKPAFLYRYPYIYEAFDLDWGARNRINSRLDEIRGGRVSLQAHHTFERLIPPSLFKEHPEYFPLIGGKRVTGYVQRCLTAPGIVELTATNMIQWMDSEPQQKYFALGQNDYENYCLCPNCSTIMEEEGSPAGLYIQYVNKVAEIVEKKHPNKYLVTFAYAFTEKPPKSVKPRQNVFIQLAPIDICVSHPFTTCSDPASIKFKERFEGWSRLTDRMSVWHYVTDFRHLLMPFPDFKEFTEDIKTYHQKGVRGIFFQGSGGHGPGSADADLRAWVMARLLWNPYQNADKLVNEYLHGVYGKAFKPMRAYYDLMHAQVLAPDRHLHVFDRVTEEMWPESVVSQMEILHDQALELAQGDETASYYVKKSRLAVTYLRLILNSGRLEIKNGEYVPVGNTVSLEDYDQFVEELNQFDVRELREESRDAKLLHMIGQRLKKHKIVTIENKDIRLDAVPDLGGRIVRLIYKKSSTNIINLLEPTENFYPVCGGYDEVTAWKWGGTGFANSYEAKVEGRSLILKQKKPEAFISHYKTGLRFIRKITLPEVGARIHISSSIINENKVAKTYKLVCRMNLNADPKKALIMARLNDGSFVAPVSSDPERSGRFYGANKPAGVWRLEHIVDNLTLEHHFDRDQVVSCRYSDSEKSKWAKMEIHTQEQEVPPGGKISMEHEWIIKQGSLKP
jgi:hypothetical protein